MGRKEQRIQKKLEKNPVRELNKIQTNIIVSCSGSLPRQKIPGIRVISYIQTG